MTKQELFKKYNIDESHSEWDNSIDNWMSVELYRVMHNGDLPPQNDTSVKWITDFLDKKNDMKWWVKNVMSRPDWGSLFLTAQRMVFSLSEQIIAEKPQITIPRVSGCLSSKINNKMRSYKTELEAIANDLLTQNADAKGNENKPNYSNRDFMNATIIFQTALMDKMYDNQDYDGMSVEDRMKMAESCGLALRKLIHTYTGLDTHKVEEFL